mmetsp:Transcript_13148/g.42847  ORF Transcript_13148/g.42847 Transcript_13148/m.42847 type:complete len:89 (+) Transcript_13148:76-342(+)
MDDDGRRTAETRRSIYLQEAKPPRTSPAGWLSRVFFSSGNRWSNESKLAGRSIDREMVLFFVMHAFIHSGLGGGGGGGGVASFFTVDR